MTSAFAIFIKAMLDASKQDIMRSEWTSWDTEYLLGADACNSNATPTRVLSLIGDVILFISEAVQSGAFLIIAAEQAEMRCTDLAKPCLLRPFRWLDQPDGTAVGTCH